MENKLESFKEFANSISLKIFQEFFFGKIYISPAKITTWNDFVFMNFLGIESLLNKSEEIIQKFKASDFKLKINTDKIYVKLAQYTTLNFSN